MKKKTKRVLKWWLCCHGPDCTPCIIIATKEPVRSDDRLFSDGYYAFEDYEVRADLCEKAMAAFGITRPTRRHPPIEIEPLRIIKKASRK